MLQRVSDDRPAAGNQLENQRDYGKNEEYVNEPSQRVAGHQTHQPKHQQDYEDRPEHVFTPFGVAAFRFL